MKLADYLRKSDLSARQFAERIGVSAITVNRYVAGTRRPDWDVMHRIVTATNGSVTADDFLQVQRLSRRGNVAGAVA